MRRKMAYGSALIAGLAFSLLSPPLFAREDTTLRERLRSSVAFMFVWLLTSQGYAADLSPGDIVVADFNVNSIVKVDPATAEQTELCFGQIQFNTPRDVAVNGRGNILVADEGSSTRPGKVIECNPVTGAQTLISSGGALVRPEGIVIGPSGDVFVVDSGPDATGTLADGAVVRVNPVSGTQSVVSSGNLLRDPIGIEVDPLGNIYVTEFRGAGTLLQIDPGTGIQTIISAGGNLQKPRHLTREPTGMFAVATGDGLVVRINPTTGDQSLIASGFGFLEGIAVEDTGDLIVSQLSQPNQIIRIDAVTGAPTSLLVGGVFRGVEGLAIVPSTDADGDFVPDVSDNCISDFNPSQEDTDGDQLGDACDPFPDDSDNLGACLTSGELDSDADGEPDITDVCSNTPPSTEVDSNGCSLDEFCSAIDATTSLGRRICRRSDWQNDEPLRPADCTVDRAGTFRKLSDDRCVVR